MNSVSSNVTPFVFNDTSFSLLTTFYLRSEFGSLNENTAAVPNDKTTTEPMTIR